LGCALGVESLAILNDTQAIERVGRLETLFSERLERLSHFAAVRTTRGLGGVAVIELHTNAAQSYLDKRGPGLTKEFIKRGLLLRPLGNVVYFVPPYVITDEEAQWAFDVIEEVLGTETS
ncbi:MAG: aminotransferase class III-fold pyridoxal phosphate-dependent enzyme, partial [Planctomycetes bacterium]|nr:aminotransferase class III-fold pyridoxal phosphate-dependent enzyme [Planctomycetota bacterium]